MNFLRGFILHLNIYCDRFTKCNKPYLNNEMTFSASLKNSCGYDNIEKKEDKILARVVFCKQTYMRKGNIFIF